MCARVCLLSVLVCTGVLLLCKCVSVCGCSKLGAWLSCCAQGVLHMGSCCLKHSLVAHKQAPHTRAPTDGDTHVAHTHTHTHGLAACRKIMASTEAFLDDAPEATLAATGAPTTEAAK